MGWRCAGLQGLLLLAQLRIDLLPQVRVGRMLSDGPEVAGRQHPMLTFDLVG